MTRVAVKFYNHNTTFVVIDIRTNKYLFESGIHKNQKNAKAHLEKLCKKHKWELVAEGVFW